MSIILFSMKQMQLKKNIAISESGFVFDPSSGDSFSLNPVGMEILEYLKEGKDLNEITGIMTKNYEIDADSFEKYFYDFIGTLKQFGLIE